MVVAAYTMVFALLQQSQQISIEVVLLLETISIVKMSNDHKELCNR